MESENPVSQIVQILNAHLNSLQWIDQTSTQLATKINDIDRLYREQVAEQERGYHRKE